MPLYRIELKPSVTSADLIARASAAPGFREVRPGARWVAREVEFRRALKHDERVLTMRERLASQAIEISFHFPDIEEGWGLVLHVPGYPLEIACDENAELEERLRVLAATLGGELLVEDE